MTAPVPEPAPAAVERRSRLSAIVRSQEGAIFLIGSACLTAILLWVLECYEFDRAKAGVMLAILPAHVLTGRAAGIAIALSSKRFSPLEAIALATLIEGMVVCLFFSAFCLVMKKMVHAPWLHQAMQDVQDSARRQRHLVARWGVPALILFVWFPLTMTGPLVGSVIGYLLGLRYWVTLGSVMAGTVAAIICWTYLMEQMTNLMRSVGPMASIVGIAVVLTAIIVVRVRAYRKSLARAADQNPPAQS